MPPLEICRPGPEPLWPVRKYGYDDDEDNGGSSEVKMLTVIGVIEACNITEESMDYSGDSEPLWTTVPLFNTNSEMRFQGKR